MKNKEKIYLIVTIVYMFLYAISGALGYSALLTGSQACLAWCVGLLCVAVLTHIGILAVEIWLDHKKKGGNE